VAPVAGALALSLALDAIDSGSRVEWSYGRHIVVKG
jgi:hypothetical protein